MMRRPRLPRIRREKEHYAENTVTDTAREAGRQAAALGAKAAKKAARKTLRDMAASVRELMTALFAGSSTAMLVVVMVCLLGLLCASAYGILLVGSSQQDGAVLRSVIRSINEEYNARIDELTATPCDELELGGSCTPWKDVLAVYAARTTLDPENPQEVFTMDDAKAAALWEIFWDMNSIQTRRVSRKETVLTEREDGKIVSQEITKTRLYVTVSHKMTVEMAREYGFSEEQKQAMTELLQPEMAALWSQVLYGTGSGDQNMVNVALSQVGNVGGRIFWSWYGFRSRVEWCACFVSWCADQCGYIEDGTMPKFAAVSAGEAWFKDHNRWANRDYIPNPGDIIFFDWEPNGEPNHVGIVQAVEDGIVYTIEGNSSNGCREREYAVGSKVIYGYGISSLKP